MMSPLEQGSALHSTSTHMHASTNIELRARLLAAQTAFPSTAPMRRRVYPVRKRRDRIPPLNRLLDKLVQPFLDKAPSDFIKELLRTRERNTQRRKHTHARQYARQRRQAHVQEQAAQSRLQRLRNWLRNAA